MTICLEPRTKYKWLGGNGSCRHIWYDHLYYTESQALTGVRKMSLDDIDLGDEAQDRLFTQYTINTVYASYSAAQHRVRQYTHLLELLRREVDEWAMKVEKASHIMPDYKPVWLLQSQ